MRRITLFAVLVVCLFVRPNFVFGVTAVCDLNATTANFSSQLAAAQPGQTLCLAGGNYGAFTGATKASPGVTVTPAAGASPTPYLQIQFGTAAWLIFDGIRIGGGQSILSGTAHDITIKNCVVSNQIVYEGSGNNVIIDNCDFNLADIAPPNVPSPEGRLEIWGNGGLTVKNSKFHGNCADGIQTGQGNGDGVTIGPGNEFYNLMQGSCGGHIDSIQFVGSATPGPTISGNYFHDDEDGIVAWDQANDMTVTNNVIANMNNGFYISIGNLTSATVVAHNTVLGPIWCSNDHNGGDCPIQIHDNIATEIGVGNGTPGTFIPTFNDYNLCTASTCVGAHSTDGIPTYVGGSAPSTYGGFQLISTSLGAGSGSNGTNIGINPTSTTTSAPTAPTGLSASVQ